MQFSHLQVSGRQVVVVVVVVMVVVAVVVKNL